MVPLTSTFYKPFINSLAFHFMSLATMLTLLVQVPRGDILCPDYYNIATPDGIQSERKSLGHIQELL